MRNSKLIIAILTFIVFVSFSVNAQNYNDGLRLSEPGAEFDARTLALGNSTIASWGNFSSSLINPAGLATIRKNVINFSFNSNKFQNSVEFFNSTLNSNKENSKTNQFSLVLPLPTKKGSAVLAFGYNISKSFNSILSFNGFNNENNSMIQDLTSYNDDLAYELGVSYPVYNSSDEYLNDATNINGKLRQRGKITEQGNIGNWVMSGAAEVAKDIFVGATFNVISGDYLSNRNYWENDYEFDNYSGLLDPSDSSTLGFESFYINDIVDWDINGWDFRLGLLFNPNSMLSFGASIKFPTSLTIGERYSIYGESQFTNNNFAVDSPGDLHEYDIKTPMEISAGVSASFALLTINASAKLIDYSQLEYTNGFEQKILLEKNEEIDQLLESVVNLNFGAELTLPYPALKIRTGFIYNPSPFIGDGNQYDKKYFTAGLGFPISRNLIFDGAYMYGWWKNFGDNYGVDVSRTYQDISLDKFVLSLSYSFM